MRNNVTSHAPGERFGRLVIVGEDPTQYPDRKVRWICRCDCGTTKAINGRYLRSGQTRSCGCWCTENRRAGNGGYKKHGLAAKVPEYHIWVGMRQRCRDANDHSYPRYGGRGITVAPEWELFETFYADMGPRPSPRHSIDRIDNDGPYAPWNCRWALAATQASNRRCTRVITYNGRAMVIADWAREVGIKATTIYARLRAGWPPERILTTPAP